MQNQIISFSGRKGSGKSTLMARVLRRSERLVIWDPLGEHTWCPNPFTDPGELAEFIKWSRTERCFAARYIPQGDPIEEIDEFCFQCYRRGDLTVAVEEVPLFASAGAMPPEFGRIVRLGRHRRVDLFHTGQRFAEIPRTLTGMTDMFCIFQVTEPRDLDALADRIGRDGADRVARLQRYEALVYDVQTRQTELVSSRGEPLHQLSGKVR